MSIITELWALIEPNVKATDRIDSAYELLEILEYHDKIDDEDIQDAYGVSDPLDQALDSFTSKDNDEDFYDED